MEKQLLFLLDWDLRITPEDLYTHLEPFLAPIRRRQQRQQEREDMAKMIKQREKEQKEQRIIQSTDVAGYHRRSRSRNGTYDSPSYSPTCQYIERPTPALSTSSSYSWLSHRRMNYHSRNSSLSPPCSSDVPGLSRSGSSNTVSSASSDASSSSNTPASVMSSYIDAEEDFQMHRYPASPAQIIHLPHQPIKAHPL